MSDFFNKFRQKIVSAVYPQDGQEAPQSTETIDNLISLGVLLWEVAQADEKYLPAEEAQLKDVLKDYGKITDEDMPIVVRAIEEASIERIDLHTFTREVGGNLSFNAKIDIVGELFRVACADKDLDHQEHEMIRKISGLFNIEHKDFIETKIRIKKEFGLDTAGL